MTAAVRTATVHDATVHDAEPLQVPGASQAAEVRGPTDRGRASPAATLAVVAAATLLILMVYTAPMAVLPDTVAHLHAGPAGQAWILSSISLGLSATVLTAGSLADTYGRRRIFLSGAVGLAGASAVSALATNLAVFVIGRVLQGVAGAALLTAGLGLIGHTHTTVRSRVRATAVFSAAMGAGMTVGPLATAGLATVGQPAPYWAMAAAALLLVPVAARALGESRAAVRRRADPLGAVTLGVGVGALTAALVEGRNGWTGPIVLVLFGVAALALAGYVVTALRGREPMLDLRLLRRPGFALSVGGSMVTGVAVIGFAGYIPSLLQGLMGMSPLGSAAVIGIWSATSMVVSLAVTRAPAGVRARRQLALGLFVAGVGFAGLYGIGTGTSWVRLAPGLFAGGVGVGLLNSALARVAVESVPSDRAAMGAGAANTARYVGASLGAALTVIVVQSAPGSDPAEVLTHGGEIATLLSVGLALIGGVAALMVRDADK